jgi:methyl-accepting chemotaxis protein
MFLKTATARNIAAIIAAALSTAMLMAGFLYYFAQENSRRQADERIASEAQAGAALVSDRMNAMMTLPRTIRAALLEMKAHGIVDRDVGNGLIKHLLQDYPDVFGLYTLWEPNAYDGRDADFVGKPGHDASGRYIPYFTRSGSNINLTPLGDYELDGAGDYYQLPKKTLKDSLTEPYSYPLDGKNVLMVSFTIPVIIDGKFAGMTGIDKALGDLSTELGALKPMGTGHVMLLSAKGAVVSHPDPTLLGKSLAGSGLNVEAFKSLMDNPGRITEVISNVGEQELAIAVPVKLLDNTTWYSVTTVPRSTVLAATKQFGLISLGLIAISAVVMILSGAYLARRFGRRIGGIVAATTSLASGSTSVDLSEIRSKDEIGDLARALEVLREGMLARVKLENEASSARVQNEYERQARDAEQKQRNEATQFAVTQIAEGLERLAVGDMTCRLEAAFTQDLDGIRSNFNETAKKLEATLQVVGKNASAIEAGSAEIRSASDELAKRTEQQAASVEETAAALEEITSSVRDASRRAEDAGELVDRTRIGAERSGEVVKKAVVAMSNIENSSMEISNIIGVIDEIAFQTNLLALNAGVEAARAGDAGKGFAVVAQEVRELAQRSANAAKEIKTLIVNSGQQVKTGVGLVGETGVALTEIVTQVQDINMHVASIVQSSREQSTALNEISAAVNTIDQGTQKNAAMVEESTAASHALASEAAELNTLLSQFRFAEKRLLSGADHRAITPIRAAPRLTPAGLNSATPLSPPSPVRAIGNRLASVFGAKTSASAALNQDWEEF